MTRFDALKKKLENRQKVIGTTMGFFSSTLLVDKMDRPDIDFLLFDAEHGIYNSENLIQHLQICRLKGIPSIVRIPDAEYHLVSRMIYVGADGIMLPRTESLEQMDIAVQAMYFSPIGKMGCGGHGEFREGESFEDYQKGGRILLPQIESPEGIRILPALIDKYRSFIGGIVIGPYDMSIMVGTPKNIRSGIMLSSIQKVFDICNEKEMSCGIFCDDEERASVYRSMGANILWSGIDINYFMRGYKETIDAFAKIQ